MDFEKSDIDQLSYSENTSDGAQQYENVIKINNSFMKLLHGYLLITFPLDIIIDLYNRNLLTTKNEVLNGKNLVQHFWNEKEFTPTLYLNILLENIETMLKGSKAFYDQFGTFVESALYNGAFLLNIHSTGKFLSERLRIKKHLLECVHTVLLSYFPNARAHKIKTGKNKKGLFGIYSICQNTESPKNNSSTLDAEFVFAPFIKTAPLFLSSTSYSRYIIISQEQEIEQRLSDKVDYRFTDSILYINNIQYGIREKFGNILTEKYAEIDNNILESKEKEVTLVTKDFICPVRKRVVLKKNCIYGAPCTMIAIYEDIDNEQNENNLCYNESLWNIILEKHYALCRKYDHKIKIIFDKSMKIILINNIPLINGVQAKIFSAIIKMHIYQKRDLFEWRDLAADEELICDPFSTGLSTRLNRLIESLKKNKCGFYITKMNRGKYKLEYEEEFQYDEKS